MSATKHIAWWGDCVGRFVRWVLWLAAILYTLACAALWAYQGKLIFFPGTVESHVTPASFGARFRPLRIAVAGGQLDAWLVEPARPTSKLLIFFHGDASPLADNAEHAVRLSRLGASVLVFDYRGFGASTPVTMSQETVFEDARAVMDFTHALGYVDQQIYLYGHSLGGAPAVEMAREYPSCAGLIVESTFTSIYDMSRREWQYRVLPVSYLLHDRFDNLEAIQSETLPKLFIYGTADELVPPAMMVKLYQAAPGPKWLVPIDGGGHANNPQVGGPVYDESIRSFLARTPRPVLRDVEKGN